jgi:cytochrome c2
MAIDYLAKSVGSAIRSSLARNRLGPSLAGIIGRKAGTIAGFDYSEANKNSNVVWDEAQLDRYLSNPKQFMPLPSGVQTVTPL